MVRHLVGAGIGVVAVPVLLVLSLWSLREQQLFIQALYRGHGVLFLASFLLLGAAVGVLSAGRLVSPVASLVSGGILFLLCLVYWTPFLLGVRPPLNSVEFLVRSVGYTPTMLVLSAVLLVASAFPSRWRASRQPLPPPQPFPPPTQQPPQFPAPEVRP